MDSVLEPEEPIISPPWGEIGRVITLAVVSLTGKLVLNWWNTTDIKNQSTFLQHLQHRQQGLGLITVSNHTSTIDDPFVISAMVPWSYFWTEHRHHGVRWALCAKEICYINQFLGQFFQSGKTLAIERGKGLNQPVMRVAAQRVARGDWLHVFPEGRVGYAGTMGAFKWGIGKIVCDSIRSGQQLPLILPFYHSGLADILPKGTMAPRPGNEVTINVGSLIDVSDLAPRCNCEGNELQQAWKEITSRIEDAMRHLESQSVPNKSQMPRVDKEGESTAEVAPKLPSKTE